MAVTINGTDGITFNDGSEQGAAASPIGPKNLIINGDMRIAQRGTSVTGITGSGYYTVDRFDVGGGSFGTWTMSQDTDVPTGQGFSKSIKWQCTTANASLSATSFFDMHQSLEGQMLQHLKYGTSSAEKLTLSFWVKSNKTGTYQYNLYSADNSGKAVNGSFTINTADTWEKKTITYNGDTSDSLDNDSGRSLDIQLILAAGSNFTGGTASSSWTTWTDSQRAPDQTVNLADSTSNYINITGVQLEVGDTATPFEHRPYEMEFMRCQRYYQTSWGTDSGIALTAQGLHFIAYSNVILMGAIMYPTRMRATPTTVVYGSAVGNANDIETATNSSVGGTWNFVGQSGTKATQINGSGATITTGELYQFEFTADAEL